MTDKQIIIDGVDVSWCEHYTGNIGYLTDKNWTCRAKIQGTKCEDWSDCYFKRWQRKEQECERTKERLESFQKDYSKLYQVVENKGYIKELDQLKAELEAYKMEADEGKEINAELKAENEELKATFDDLFKGQYKLADNNKKLRQCLTEIKEIIHFNKTNRLSGGADISIEQILQKISEVE